MNALRWHGRNDIRIDEVAIPKVNSGEVKIKIEWCGICGSDLYEYKSGPLFIPESKSHPLTGRKAPVILGHEIAGEVVEVAHDVKEIQVGDRVTVEPIRSCGTCVQCNEGYYNLCSNRGFHGFDGGGGGLAEYTTCNADMVHKLPKKMSMEQAALVEPLAAAIHAIRRGRFAQGQTAAIFGTGPIGLALISAVKVAGAKKIIAVEIAEKRRKIAKEFGADIVLNSNEEDVIAEITKLTDGQGVDIAFETTGVEVSYNNAVTATINSGKIVVVSLWGKEIEINLNDLVLTEKEVIGSIAYRDVFPVTMTLIAEGSIKPEKMITKQIGLEEAVEEGFNELVVNKDENIKILVNPSK
ncbi:2,3-butanediol dehydrogenase [Selenihalanaerobacter shriftii]